MNVEMYTPHKSLIVVAEPNKHKTEMAYSRRPRRLRLVSYGSSIHLDVGSRLSRIASIANVTAIVSEKWYTTIEI